MVRDVDLATLEVCVYKNLNKGGWSITSVKGNDNKGLLLAHATEVMLVGARAVVKESRRQAIQAGGYREVCAWFVGKITDVPHMVRSDRRVTFRPHQRPAFFIPDTGVDVWTADGVWFSASGQAWIQ